ncbi:glycosyltransferase family 87 protein [Humibacillus xanthopallidus]|uniref:glycosyltransferase family 87 protein n=1 Tax=Humibacillus xanthopallidus TaxID=412689 RepID=UPI001639CDAC|nr:glycosyltransferase family 87 protein [Humibacillus xanthopallidus]
MSLVRRVDAKVTRKRVQVWALASATVFVAALVTAWLTIPELAAFPDFAARWSAGRLVVTGQGSALYDLARQAEVQRNGTGTDQFSWFVSPPFVAVLFAPLSLLPYWLACLVWLAISTSALWLSVRLLRPWAPAVLADNWRTTTLVIWTSYPVLQVLFVGQDTTLVLLAVAAGVHLLSRDRAYQAGACLGLGLVKPHLIFLVPVLLVLRRQPRALAGFIAVAVVFTVVSLVMMGPGGISRWLAVVSSGDYSKAVQQGFAWKGVNVSALLTGLAPADFGRWWQLLATLTGLAACVPALRAVTIRRDASQQFAWALVLATTVIAAPHVLVYDLVLIIPVVFALAWTGWDAVTRLTLVGMTAALWLAAPIQLLLAGSSWPVTSLGAPWAALGAFLLWYRLLRRPSDAALPPERGSR